MQCANCSGTDFDKSGYNYYICKNCGNLQYEGSGSNRKSNPLSEYYFLGGLAVGIMIIVILILLFMTALSRKDRIKPVIKSGTVQVEKK